MSEIVPGRKPNPIQVERALEKLLSVQRPLVLAHVRGIRRRNPHASPADVITILERHYLAAVTAGGAAVGASAVIPGVGVGISLALSSVETGGFLEVTALFTQSVTEVHGIAVDDPDRARTLVMTMMLGDTGTELIKQLAGQVSGTGPSRNAFWGETITKGIPRRAVGMVADRVQKLFVRRFVSTQGPGIVGRAIPFGIGAVIGGTGNHLLGRKVVANTRAAFGPSPATFSPELDPTIKDRTLTEPREPRARRRRTRPSRRWKELED
ncbi:hypothetical protein BH09ACT3_BH09ACT3_09130 [soil metagenome]